MVSFKLLSVIRVTIILLIFQLNGTAIKLSSFKYLSLNTNLCASHKLR